MSRDEWMFLSAGEKEDALGQLVSSSLTTRRARKERRESAPLSSNVLSIVNAEGAPTLLHEASAGGRGSQRAGAVAKRESSERTVTAGVAALRARRRLVSEHMYIEQTVL